MRVGDGRKLVSRVLEFRDLVRVCGGNKMRISALGSGI